MSPLKGKIKCLVEFKQYAGNLIAIAAIADKGLLMSFEPEENWKSIAGVFGLPIERDEIDGYGPDNPWLTWITGFLIAVVSLVSLTQGHRVTHAWGLIPSEAWRHYGLTFITSFFLHASLWHLLTNLYFLVVFGGSVERYAGSWRWLLIIGPATLLGGAIDVAIQAQSPLPLVGASGGISGLLVYYGLKFPAAQLSVPIGYFSYEWKDIPARRLLLIWVLLQILGAGLQVRGISHVAALAHLGGGLAGAVFWLVWKVWPFDSLDCDDY